MEELNFNKNPDNLIPAIIQDSTTNTVLMLGYMNQEAYNKTIETKKVTFYSRTKKRLWTKGEESGNYLLLQSITPDCDNDTLLVKVVPKGPTCHKGTDTCWNQSNTNNITFLNTLEQIISNRKNDIDLQNSYIASLLKSGINKVAQKVGEEAIEMVIEAKDDNKNLFLNESADLLFHYLILLQAKNCTLTDVVKILQDRNK